MPTAASPSAPTANPPAAARTPRVPAGAAATDVVIKCITLSKVFKDFWLRPRVRAVDGIDLEVRRGEVFGLLGPNGSGKSTTIKMILGLLHPTAGRIAVFGRHPRDVQNKAQIGYLPEETYLYPFLDARETLDYYGRLFQIPSAKRRTRIDMLLEMVGLEKVANRPIGEYSKGMQRRIGLAQALINDPRLLILDEPTSGLDPIGSAHVKQTIQTLAGRGKTILLSSHLLADVQDVCDRVCIMYGGQIKEQGEIDTLLEDSHKTSITADELDDDTLREVEGVLERHGRFIERVDRPRRSLESLFLEMVAREQSRGTMTGGAGNAGHIAEFLEKGDEAEAGEAVLEGLMRVDGAAPAPSTQGDVGSEGSSVSSREADEQRLVEDLVAVEPGETPEPQGAPHARAATPGSSPPPLPDSADHAVLGDLLGAGIDTGSTLRPPSQPERAADQPQRSVGPGDTAAARTGSHADTRVDEDVLGELLGRPDPPDRESESKRQDKPSDSPTE